MWSISMKYLSEEESENAAWIQNKNKNKKRKKSEFDV
jgi:hypothetical protein